MLTVKTPTAEFTFPSTWQEVTLKQFFQLQSKAASVKADNMLPDYKFDWLIRDFLETLTSSIDALRDINAGEESEIIAHLAYLAEVPDFSTMAIPERIADVRPPTDLAKCTLLQKWTVDEHVQLLAEVDQPANYVTMAVPILSIYLYPMLTGSKLLDGEQIEAIREQIETLPVTEALPLAAFFLSNYRSSTRSGQNTYSISHPDQPPRNWLKRWFPNWKSIKSMHFGRPWPRTVI